jgi:transcriptional repressor NrdR
MKCPYCQSGDIVVKDSRDMDSGTIMRRRRCLSCSRKFTTHERISGIEVSVRKKDGRTELFDRSKVLAGIIKACEKRPVGTEDMNEMADRIEAKVRNVGDCVESSRIGELVMVELARADSVAYIRFASVYKEFGSPREFMSMVSMMKGGKRGRRA